MKIFVWLGMLFGLLQFPLKAQQIFPVHTYPQHYALPVHLDISLVGNFGECRPDHFHSGLDIRTNGKENVPVYSVQDGYISRVIMDSKGFGHAIYITHPEGYMSVYAHLNKFFPELQQYVTRQQYKTQSWKQELFLMPHQFPVRKNQWVAYSGNTGSSQGPHLHFEIRHTKTESPLNPLLFYPQLKDTKAPTIRKLAVYDGRQSIYHQSPKLFTTQAANGKTHLIIPSITVETDRVYLGIIAEDFMESAKGSLGVYEMRLFESGQFRFGWQMNDISYDLTRFMNAHVDYKSKVLQNHWIQLCHRLPHDELKIYRSSNAEAGMIKLNDTLSREILIEVLDTKGNSQQLKFQIRRKMSALTSICSDQKHPGKAHQIEADRLMLNIPPQALYDWICPEVLRIPSSNQETYQFQYDYIPLQMAVKVKIPFVPNAQHEKIHHLVLQALNPLSGGKKNSYPAHFEKGFVIGEIKQFGSYRVVYDQNGPRIKTALQDGQRISSLKKLVFEIEDEIGRVTKMRAEVNGQWLLFAQKGNVYTYEMDSLYPKGLYPLKIIAADESGNETTFALKLQR